MVSTSRLSSLGRTGMRSLGYVDHANDDRRLSRPLDPPMGTIDAPPVVADPAKAGRSGITLADRIRGDQAKGASLA